jgi:hypothetical protein
VSFTEFLAKWRAERERLSRYGQRVDPVPLLDDILQDAAAALASDQDESLTLRQAAAASGYSADHLARLIRTGRLLNLGVKHAPRLRRADLPHKPGRLPTESPPPHLLGADPRQVARAVVTSHKGGPR